MVPRRKKEDELAGLCTFCVGIMTRNSVCCSRIMRYRDPDAANCWASKICGAPKWGAGVSGDDVIARAVELRVANGRM